MRRFTCESCAEEVAFDALRCASCSSPLGYVPAQQAVKVLHPAAGAVSFSISGDDAEFWRCPNSARGCNWVLPAGTGDIWCRSCGLTPGRPDETNPDALAAWSTAEAVKRRLVHQLDHLALPIDPRSDATPDGLAFDLVYVPGQFGPAGKVDEAVTLDLADADVQDVGAPPRRVHAPFRTLIGNLRHKVGHHYWHRLVGQSDHVTPFRRLFGDERADYPAAIEPHQAAVAHHWDASRFVTGRAESHPFEDWAETFAHYLHILDATDTAEAYRLPDGQCEMGRPQSSPGGGTFAEILRLWRPTAPAVNALAASLGLPAVYPFQLTGVVLQKFEFVHARVTAHAHREHFYSVYP